MDLFSAVLLGVPMTIAVTACAFTIGAVVAVPLLLALRSPALPVLLVARGVVDLLRGIPPIVWLFILYFGISVGAVQMSPFVAAVIGLGLISAGYLAEIYRGAISAVHRGQWEAGAALGLHGRTTFGRIVAPQALRVAVPSTATYAIGLIKDSSIASTIGVTEIVFLSTSEARTSVDGRVG